MKRSSPVVLQRQGGAMYNEMSEEMMFPVGPSSTGSNERNLTPLSRHHRVDEGS